jgi:NADH-quinone oxidoreductase subunit J
MIADVAFYVFSGVMLLCALMVISARNPVHSVLFLIAAFFNAAALFLLVGAEFLAMILIVVYVGAVAVLFLFVVMMLDIDFVALRKGFMNYLPFGALIGLILLAELALAAGFWVFSGNTEGALAQPTPDGISNTEALGRILYTDYVFFFQTAGLVLLVAMIGAIVLTLRHRPGVRRQSISAQVNRDPAKAIENREVKPGEGVS